MKWWGDGAAVECVEICLLQRHAPPPKARHGHFHPHPRRPVPAGYPHPRRPRPQGGTRARTSPYPQFTRTRTLPTTRTLPAPCYTRTRSSTRTRSLPAPAHSPHPHTTHHPQVHRTRRTPHPHTPRTRALPTTRTVTAPACSPRPSSEVKSALSLPREKVEVLRIVTDGRPKAAAIEWCSPRSPFIVLGSRSYHFRVAEGLQIITIIMCTETPTQLFVVGKVSAPATSEPVLVVTFAHVSGWHCPSIALQSVRRSSHKNH